MLISLLLAFLYTRPVYSAGWTTIQRDVSVQFDLESDPLEWKSKKIGAITTKWYTYLQFFDDGSFPAGGLSLTFNFDTGNTIDFVIDGCSNLAIPEKFDKTVTHDKEIKWRFTKKKAAYNDITIRIHADDELVLNRKLGSSTCHYFDSTKWNKQATWIRFANFMNNQNRVAETEYRAYVPGWNTEELKKGEWHDLDLTTTTAGGVEILTDKKWGEDGMLTFNLGKDSAVKTSIGINFKTKNIFLSDCLGGSWKAFPGKSDIPTNKKYLVWRFHIAPGTNKDDPIQLKFWVNDAEITPIDPSSFCVGLNWKNSLSTEWKDNFKQFLIKTDDDVTIGFRTYHTGSVLVCYKNEAVLIRGETTGCAEKWYLKDYRTADCLFDGNTKVISTGVHQCSTDSSYTDDNVVYTNKALCGDPSPTDVNEVTRDKEPAGFLLTCSFSREGSLTGADWKFDGTNQVDIEGKGILNFFLKVYTDATFATVETSSTLTLELKADVHMELSVETQDTSMILGIVEVKATTAAEDAADYQGPTHHIWKNGCPDDTTAEPVTQTDTKKKRFKFKMFKFVANNDKIYIHATVKVCDSAKILECEPTCQRRKRREAVAENEENLYHVSLGPFIVTDPLEVEVKSGVCDKKRYNLLLLTMAPLPLVFMN